MLKYASFGFVVLANLLFAVMIFPPTSSTRRLAFGSPLSVAKTLLLRRRIDHVRKPIAVRVHEVL